MDVDVGDRAITISEGCTGEGLEDPKTDLLKSWPSGLSRLWRRNSTFPQMDSCWGRNHGSPKNIQKHIPGEWFLTKVSTSEMGIRNHHNWNHQIRSPCPEIRLRLWRYSRVQKRLLPYVAPLECDGAHLGTIVGKEWKLNMLGLKPPSKTHRNHRKISRWTRRYKKHHNQPSFYAVFPTCSDQKTFELGLWPKKYFTSCYPHHDIYTFSYWQIFWHSIWHIFWHSIWHSIWHILWHMFWHIFWHSIWQIFWHSIWHIFWHSIWHIFWHSIWHIFWHSIWHIFWHSIWHSIWHIFSHSIWPLRSGSAHWDLELAVKVRQCPLGSGSRGWGPAVPTAIWKSRLRSGSAHCNLEVAVEGPLGSWARGGGPAVPTGIWRSRWRSGCAHWDLDCEEEEAEEMEEEDAEAEEEENSSDKI